MLVKTEEGNIDYTQLKERAQERSNWHQ